MEEVRYVVTSPLPYLRKAIYCWKRALGDTSRPLARILLLIIPLMLISLFVESAVGTNIRLALFAGTALSLLIIVAYRFLYRLRYYNSAYSYYTKRSSDLK